MLMPFNCILSMPFVSLIKVTKIKKKKLAAGKHFLEIFILQ